MTMGKMVEPCNFKRTMYAQIIVINNEPEGSVGTITFQLSTTVTSTKEQPKKQEMHQEIRCKRIIRNRTENVTSGVHN